MRGVYEVSGALVERSFRLSRSRFIVSATRRPFMTIAELIREFEAEAKTTRRVLERVPSDKLAWTPHARSMSLGRLAMHLASAPSNISAWPVSDHFEFTGDPTPVPTCTADIVAA